MLWNAGAAGGGETALGGNDGVVASAVDEIAFVAASAIAWTAVTHGGVVAGSLLSGWCCHGGVR